MALAVDARMPTYAALPIDAGECVDAVVVPDEDVALLDVEAIDEQGRVVARAKEGSGSRTLTVCSPIQMAGTLSVRPHVGRGLAAVVLARAAGDASRDFSALPGRRVGRADAAARQGEERARRAAREERLRRRRRRRRRAR